MYQFTASSESRKSISSAIVSTGLRRFESTVDMELKEKLLEHEEVCLFTLDLIGNYSSYLLYIFFFAGNKGIKRLGTFKTELA